MSNDVVLTDKYSEALILDKRIKANAQAAQDSLYDVCTGLKSMRDGKLYKELGFQNFDDYCDSELGFTRMQAHRFIKIAESFSNDNVTSMLHLGSTKLFLLSKLSDDERQELTDNIDVSETSTRELEEKIKELKCNFEIKSKECSEKNIKNHDLISQVSDLEVKLKNKVCDIEELRKKIEELENRPVDVAVSDDSERVDLLNKQLDEAHKQINELVGQLEHVEDLHTALPESVHKQIFKAYLTNCIDTGNRLLSAAQNYPEFKDKAIEYFDTMLIKLKE